MNGSLREDARAGFTWFPGDWLSDEGVRSVSFAAKGLWIGMLCLMARSAKRGKLLTNVLANGDSKWLAKQLGGTAEEIDTLLAELERERVFSRHEGAIICRKMWRQTDLSDKRAEAGRLGALAKHQQNESGKTQQNLATVGKDRNGRDRSGSFDFDQFWSLYPRKVGKKAASKAWDKAKDKPALEVLLVALEAQKKSEQWKKDGGQYIPNPATWLNQGRWDDEAHETSLQRLARTGKAD
ncbi:hypothetical protein ES708_02724 [subsurface metagenome]